MILAIASKHTGLCCEVKSYLVSHLWEKSRPLVQAHRQQLQQQLLRLLNLGRFAGHAEGRAVTCFVRQPVVSWPRLLAGAAADS